MLRKELIYVVSLKAAHDRTKLSSYKVHKLTGVNIGTVKRYARSDAVEIAQLSVSIATLCEFYGVDFHDVVTIKKSRMMAAV